MNMNFCVYLMNDDIYFFVVRSSLSYLYTMYLQYLIFVSLISGFISLSDVISSTQYIAPLMANFRPLPENAPTQDIRLLYNSDSLVIQWLVNSK